MAVVVPSCQNGKAHKFQRLCVFFFFIFCLFPCIWIRFTCGLFVCVFVFYLSLVCVFFKMLWQCTHWFPWAVIAIFCKKKKVSIKLICLCSIQLFWFGIINISAHLKCSCCGCSSRFSFRLISFDFCHENLAKSCMWLYSSLVSEFKIWLKFPLILSLNFNHSLWKPMNVFESYNLCSGFLGKNSTLNIISLQPTEKRHLFSSKKNVCQCNVLCLLNMNGCFSRIWAIVRPKIGGINVYMLSDLSLKKITWLRNVFR